MKHKDEWVGLHHCLCDIRMLQRLWSYLKRIDWHLEHVFNCCMFVIWGSLDLLIMSTKWKLRNMVVTYTFTAITKLSECHHFHYFVSFQRLQVLIGQELLFWNYFLGRLF